MLRIWDFFVKWDQIMIMDDFEYPIPVSLRHERGWPFYKTRFYRGIPIFLFYIIIWILCRTFHNSWPGGSSRLVSVVTRRIILIYFSHKKAIWKGSHNLILRGQKLTIWLLPTETNGDDPPSSLPGHPLVRRFMTTRAILEKRNMFKAWIRAFFKHLVVFFTEKSMRPFHTFVVSGGFPESEVHHPIFSCIPWGSPQKPTNILSFFFFFFWSSFTYRL